MGGLQSEVSNTDGVRYYWWLTLKNQPCLLRFCPLLIQYPRPGELSDCIENWTGGIGRKLEIKIRMIKSYISFQLVKYSLAPFTCCCCCNTLSSPFLPNIAPLGGGWSGLHNDSFWESCYQAVSIQLPVVLVAQLKLSVWSTIVLGWANISFKSGTLELRLFLR